MMPVGQQQTVTNPKQANIFPHAGLVSRQMRNQRLGHRSGVVWLTGLSGAGKSTISARVEHALFEKGCLVTVLDGDSLRSGLNADLDFTRESRQENLRRASEVAGLFAATGHIVLATFVSPFQAGREFVRKIIRDEFYLVHVNAKLDDCIERDPKGLYKKALSGGIENFTGIGQGYEPPADADLQINTSDYDIADSCQLLYDFIVTKFGVC